MEYKDLQNELTALIKFRADSGECVKMTLQHAKDYDLRHRESKKFGMSCVAYGGTNGRQI
jgi:hypothetical protein